MRILSTPQRINTQTKNFKKSIGRKNGSKQNKPKTTSSLKKKKKNITTKKKYPYWRS